MRKSCRLLFGDRIMSMKNFMIILAFCIFLSLSGCSILHVPAEPTLTPTPEPTETPIPVPTPTIPPSAASVNGLYVTLDDLDAQKAQLHDAYAALGQEIPSEDALREEALDDLINETLFLSAALNAGLAPTAGDLDARIQALTEKMGGADALRQWREQNHYSEESFRRALERETAASNMRETIFERLKTAEQLHVYRIWSSNRNDLTNAVSKLDMGVSFIELAANYDAVTGGDMNWFPRGIMFSKELEDKIFALNTGEHTEILEADGVFNLFYVAEKQTGRVMDTQVEQIAQRNAIADWLEEQKQKAVIEIF